MRRLLLLDVLANDGNGGATTATGKAINSEPLKLLTVGPHENFDPDLKRLAH